MAQNDSAVLRPGTGYVLTGATTATQPTLAALNTFVSAGTLPAGLTELGHTDADNILAFSKDGGTTTTLGSWQNPSLLSVVTEQAIDAFTVNALEVSNTVMQYYYGGGDVSQTDQYRLPDTPTPTEVSVCVVFVGAARNVGFWVQRGSVIGDDSPNFATDAFSNWPLKFTLLKRSGFPKAAWIDAALGA